MRLKNPRFQACLALAAIILFAAFVRIRLIDIPLERDEGEYALAGQLMLHGIPPYQLAWNMKFPGTYAAYALIMAIGGQTIRAIHLGLLFVIVLSILLLYRIARGFFDRSASLAACAAFALFSLGTNVHGLAAHANHFVALFALGGTLLLFRAAHTESLARFSLSGLSFGLAVFMKQHGVLFVLFGLLWLLWSARPDLAKAVRRALAFAAGASLPLLLTGLILSALGVFPKFFFWTFRYAWEYTVETSLSEGWHNLLHALSDVLPENPALWALAAAGIVLLLRRRSPLLLFFLFSALAVCPGLLFRPNYFILILPAASLLAGAALNYGIRRLGRNIPLLLFAAALASSLYQRHDYFFRMDPFEASRFAYGINPFPEAIKIAQYIHDRTPPEARIAVLGSEPEIYFYADRLPATGFIYTYGLMEHQPFALAMQNEMIRELELARPDYVVFVSIEYSWLMHDDSSPRIFQWWNAYSRAHYTPVGLVDLSKPFHTDYWWDDEVVQHPIPSSPHLLIERRDPDPPPIQP